MDAAVEEVTEAVRAVRVIADIRGVITRATDAGALEITGDILGNIHTLPAHPAHPVHLAPVVAAAAALRPPVRPAPAITTTAAATAIAHTLIRRPRVTLVGPAVHPARAAPENLAASSNMSTTEETDVIRVATITNRANDAITRPVRAPVRVRVPLLPVLEGAIATPTVPIVVKTRTTVVIVATPRVIPAPLVLLRVPPLAQAQVLAPARAQVLLAPQVQVLPTLAVQVPALVLALALPAALALLAQVVQVLALLALLALARVPARAPVAHPQAVQAAAAVLAVK